MRNVREMGYIKGWRGLTKDVWRRGRLPETDRGSKSSSRLGRNTVDALSACRAITVMCIFKSKPKEHFDFSH